jgi:GNAT superfamily N-acetyltransferase
MSGKALCGRLRVSNMKRLAYPLFFILRRIKMDYAIKHVTSEHELDAALVFAQKIFDGHPSFKNEEELKKEWLEHMNNNNELLLFIGLNGEVFGIAFGFIEDNGNMTVGIVAVDERLRNTGVAKKLMSALEERAKALGVHLIVLGSVQSAEGFYKKCGYTGSLLVQSENHSINEMLALNTEYEVRYTNVYNGKINQVCLALPEADCELQRRYKTELPGCHTQTMFWKNI